MRRCKEKIWVENIRDLFLDFTLIPMQGMSLENKINSSTRLVFFIFIVLLLLVDFSFSLIFLLSSLLFIIIIYYIQRKKMQASRENYKNCPSTAPLASRSSPIITPGPGYVSKNQRLKGNVNPKTKLKPIIAPRLTDLDHWKYNNNIIHSHANFSRPINTYLSGSTSSTLCGYDTECDYSRDCPQFLPHVKGNSLCQESVENYVNTGCGECNAYNNGMPVNMSGGLCQHDPVFQKLNENISIEPINPGIYVKNQVNETINSNIGISYQQQRQPVTGEILDNGNILYTENASEIYPEEIRQINTDVYNVYDPRHTSYGNKERAYVHPVTGQIRYWYKDVDTLKSGNYSVRSNIDHIREADHNGIIEAGNENGNINTHRMRNIAEGQRFLNETKHRESIMLSVSKKGRNKREQQKQFPINTTGQRQF